MAEVKFRFYHYDPSFVAAAIFIVLFGISTLGHIIQLVRFRTWYFIPFVIGGFFETIGYVGRALSSKQPSGEWTLPPYIMQSLLLLLAPALFAASIYMVLGRIIHLTDGESHAIIRARWLTKIFVGGDVLSFLVQSGGGGMLAKSKSQDDAKLGTWIITGGLLIQIAFFGFFIFVSGFFNYRLRKVPTDASSSASVPWQRYLFVLYATSGLVLIRSTFRVVEYIGGQDGVLLSTESYLYIFDAALMFMAMAIFNFWHPSSIIPRKRSMDTEHNARGSVHSNIPLQKHHRLRRSKNPLLTNSSVVPLFFNMEPHNDENKKSSTNMNGPSTKVANDSDDEELSLINRKFLISGRAFQPPPDYDTFLGFRPQYFFFYGSLMDARQLRKVLQLEETPVLQSASITGWDIMMWGQYPALIFKPNNITHGMAFEVQKGVHVEYLTCYESETYRLKGCRIKLADGRELPGKTFIWNGANELLKEGTSDLKDWQMEQLEK
ncbi:uncharacterized protein BP5553_01326 [Venustampulla echinocandica]|uniref:Gamma-glutamylcyclotransferase AIG2-like domain-containing protein n=1 Tax=Venustampulla echinocandica TaxID=2656787 RepID=A0A370U0Q3_9HELO|nr:uncharacterized protein BP5553_01326 [Venustampulla echinocandica]RDL41347.1 hypothetical protein BP5553_01326 [Venustampulla echinocandica]